LKLIVLLHDFYKCLGFIGLTTRLRIIARTPTLVFSAFMEVLLLIT
jgi:hypothetical protein